MTDIDTNICKPKFSVRTTRWAYLAVNGITGLYLGFAAYLIWDSASLGQYDRGLFNIVLAGATLWAFDDIRGRLTRYAQHRAHHDQIENLDLGVMGQNLQAMAQRIMDQADDEIGGHYL